MKLYMIYLKYIEINKKKNVKIKFDFQYVVFKKNVFMNFFFN